MKDGIAVHLEKCAGCQCCQLICSLVYTGAFNPEKARIEIDSHNGIYFSDECKEGCVLCTNYCVFGAIAKTKE
jgi:Fe-S-cluster-containing hydrogenase component 2